MSQKNNATQFGMPHNRLWTTEIHLHFSSPPVFFLVHAGGKAKTRKSGDESPHFKGSKDLHSIQRLIRSKTADVRVATVRR
jgi:hypothetical protein